MMRNVAVGLVGLMCVSFGVLPTSGFTAPHHPAVDGPTGRPPPEPTEHDDVEALVEGRSRLMVLSPFAYLRAKQSAPGLRIVAAERRPGFLHDASYLVVNRKAPLHHAEDLAGTRLAIETGPRSDPFSPLALLLQADVNLHRLDLRRSAEPLQALFAGQVDVAAVGAEALQRAPKAQRAAFRILAVTARTAPLLWVAAPDVPPETVRAWSSNLAGHPTGQHEFVSGQAVEDDLEVLELRWRRFEAQAAPFIAPHLSRGATSDRTRTL